MGRKQENTAFQCVQCGASVHALTNGSFRNHCPYCLYSKHLDDQPGDRSSDCHGLMRPIDLCYSGNKGYQLIHQCKRCGKIVKNKVAENTVQEDQLIPFLKKTTHV